MTPPAAEQPSRLAAWLWGLVLLCCTGLLIQQLASGSRWDTRIVSLLPDTPQTALLMQAEARLTEGMENDMVLLVSG